MNNNYNKVINKAHVAYDNSLDKAVYFFSFLGPVMSIPQIIQAYTVSTNGLSVWTWLAYSINSVFWVLYALHKKMNILAFSEVLWSIVHFVILFKVLWP
jgi:Sugar efflux transporter for intercellular exchange